jgi:hypothetical protein
MHRTIRALRIELDFGGLIVGCASSHFCCIPAASVFCDVATFLPSPLLCPYRAIVVYRIYTMGSSVQGSVHLLFAVIWALRVGLVGLSGCGHCLPQNSSHCLHSTAPVSALDFRFQLACFDVPQPTALSSAL